MSRPTDKQLDMLLRLANELTGDRARYLRDSPIDLDARTDPEASALIDALQDAIDAEQKRQAETGIRRGAKVSFRFTRRTGEDGGRLSGKVRSFRWSGMQAAGVWLDDLDTSQATWEVPGTIWFALDRMSEIRIGDGAEALLAERARLAARIAEIDAVLATGDETGAMS